MRDFALSVAAGFVLGVAGEVVTFAIGAMIRLDSLVGWLVATSGPVLILSAIIPARLGPELKKGMIVGLAMATIVAGVCNYQNQDGRLFSSSERREAGVPNYATCTARKPAITEAATFTTPHPAAPASARRCVSYSNVEKVVNAPMKPVAMKRLPAKKPMANEPVTLIRNVASGKSRRQKRATSSATA